MSTSSSVPLSDPLPDQVELRSAQDVMRLTRMGASFPTRLSFMRTLIRDLAADEVSIERVTWSMTDDGFGRAVYTLTFRGFVYSLVAFSTALEPSQRTDRVIAEAWDASFVLFDGRPSAEDLDRLEQNAPHQEAGRFTPTELVLSRANKSVRLFQHVIEQLAAGQQPDDEQLQSTGYLMRTTAVYANGKFGLADRSLFANRPGMGGPFRAEMLTVWLIRLFSQDLVQHVAERLAPSTFTPLDRRCRTFLGIGNSTGLGMAPFLVTHPILTNNWVIARETALARVRFLSAATPSKQARVVALLGRARKHINQWNVQDERQMDRIVQLRIEAAEVAGLLDDAWFSHPDPWDRLVRHSTRWSNECQELIVALLLEAHGELVDGLAECMSNDASPHLDPRPTVADLRATIAEHFAWAIDIDFDDPHATHQFWYVSEEKLEPRLGIRREEPGAELEQPLDIARKVHALHTDLANARDELQVAELLLQWPQHRFAVRRIQTLQRCHYAEIRDNLISSSCLPIDMLRFKLAFFGASKFDPKSDRWTRITLYQGAPLADGLGAADVDDWWLPVLGATSS